MELGGLCGKELQHREVWPSRRAGNASHDGRRQQHTVDQAPVVRPGEEQGSQSGEEDDGRRRVRQEAERHEEGNADEWEPATAVQGVEQQGEA